MTVCVLAVICLAAVACGKKGPPLAPFMRVPAAPAEFSARRLGQTAYVHLVVPTRNQDNSNPADLSRVEVYGYTGKPANDADIVRYGTLVATVPVRRPPREDEDRTRKPKDARETPGGEAVSQRADHEPVDAEGKQSGFDQGASVTLTETLTPDLMQPVVVRERKAPKKPQQVSEGPAMPGIVTFDDTPSRTYVAVGVNHKGRRGIFSPRAAVPVVALPAPPTGLQVTYTEKEIRLDWKPPAGAPPVVVEKKADEGYLRGRPIVPVSAPAWFYDVFEAPPAADARSFAHSGAPATHPPPDMPLVEPPASLNREPLRVPAFADQRIEFGIERCYVVRTINVFGTLRQESEPSEPVCVTPRDTFAPAPPRSLIAVSSEGVISLSWEPNSESDLAGYLILRGEDPGAPLQPMNREPIQATTFEDKTVKAGVRYVYAVVAIDKATPPNVSKESNRIEETGR